MFDNKGHGCARLAQAPGALPSLVVITGPQRRLAQGLGWQTAMPYGDVMLSGCFGLVAAARQFWGEAVSEKARPDGPARQGAAPA